MLLLLLLLPLVQHRTRPRVLRAVSARLEARNKAESLIGRAVLLRPMRAPKTPTTMPRKNQPLLDAISFPVRALFVVVTRHHGPQLTRFQNS